MKKLLLLFCLIPFICEAGVTQADLDKFGGYIGRQGTTRYAVSGTVESVTGLSLTETGAFAGKDLEWCTVQPDTSKEIYFLIKENTDDTIYVQPCDLFYRTDSSSALEGNIIANHDMEAAGTWADYNTPSTNAQGTTGVLFDSYYWHVAGDADDGIKQTGLHIMGDRTGHSTSWSGGYKAVGYVYVVSGTVKMYAEDNTGELTDVQIGTTNGGVWEDFEKDFTAAEETIDDTGEVRFYCSGGTCEFYLDEIYIGEDDYGYYYTYQDLQDYNDGTEAYQTYGPWNRTEKIGMRWWQIDPLDNVFVTKGINNFAAAQIFGFSEDGTDMDDALRVKYTDQNATWNTMERTQSMIDMGFNCAGSIMSGALTPDDLDWDVYPLMPYHTQIRLTTSMDDTDSVLAPNVGEIDCYGTSYDSWVDVFDADWSSSLETDMWNEDIGWSLDSSPYDSFYTAAATKEINPYYSHQYAYAANPWLMGIDLDEEPAGSGSGYGVVAYYFFCSADDDTTADDGVNDTKIAFVNWLRANYTVGGEATFVANIGYDGSHEITTVASWATVPGYVDAQHNTDACTALNTAWGTTYADWTEVLAEDGDDDDGFATQADAAITGITNKLDTADAELKADMDNLQGNYSRKYLEAFNDVVFKTTAPLKGTKFNFGPGFSYHNGWPKGMKSSDESITYTPVYYKHSMGGGSSCYTDAAMSFPEDHASYDRDRDELWQDWYDLNELPFIIESWAIHAGGDSEVGQIGTVDVVYLTTDTDYAVYIGEYENGTGKIADGTAITWNGGADTGTLFWSFDLTTEAPLEIEHTLGTTDSYAAGYFVDGYVIIADSGSIGNLATGDTITDGTESFDIKSGTFHSIAYPIRVSMIVDNEANFNCDYDSPRAYDGKWNAFTFVDDDDPSPVRYYSIIDRYATETGLICYVDGQNPGGWGSFPGDFSDVNVGDNYHTQYASVTGHWQDEIYLLTTQEKKARMYESILKQCFDFKTDDGSYPFVGHCYWSAWGWGFAAYTAIETTNYGLITIKDNLYNGVEATTLGADGIADTWDDEEEDYGDCVTRISAYQNNIYRDLMPKSQSSGCQASGVSFR